MERILNSIIRSCGLMLLVLGPALILTCIVSMLCGEWQDSFNYLWMGILFLIIGGLDRFLAMRRESRRLPIGDGFLMVAVLWAMMSALGALPYLVSGVITDPAAAFFESCSGFTTTGATALTHLQDLPHGIIFWRAMTSWLGGVGILLIGVTLMPALGLNGQRLNTPDHYGPVLEEVSPRMLDGIRSVIVIYAGLTFLETLLLFLSGLGLFNALTCSMSTVSTGGFSRYDDNVAHFGGSTIPLILSAFMIVSGMNYYLFLRRPKGGIRTFLRNSEIRMYGFLLVCSFVVIAATLLLRSGGQQAGRYLEEALLQTASFLSTTGFVGSDYGRWPQLAQTILLLLMFCGGCTASAAGGIKAARVSILLKLVRRGISTRLHANFFETVKMNGQGMGTDTVSGTATMPFLYLTALFTGAFLLTLDGCSLSTAFNAAIACLCNTGHAFGTLGLGGTFAHFGTFSKWLLSLLMIGGRLELYALVIVMTPRYWSQGH